MLTTSLPFIGSLARKVSPEGGKPVGTCQSCWQQRLDLKEMNLGGTYLFLPWTVKEPDDKRNVLINIPGDTFLTFYWYVSNKRSVLKGRGA